MWYVDPSWLTTRHLNIRGTIVLGLAIGRGLPSGPIPSLLMNKEISYINNYCDYTKKKLIFYLLQQ